jgi:hypothetical protein
MGLISEKVMIGLAASNIKYFESLGYEIPRRRKDIKHNILTVPQGTKIEVFVKDLPVKSNVKIKIQCDDCGKKSMLSYCDYVNKIMDDGRSFCVACSHKLFGGENARKIKLQKSVTIKQWCISNNRLDVLDLLLDDGLINSDKYSIKSSKDFLWKCENDIHENYWRSAELSHRRNYRCPLCAQERNESLLQEKVRLYLENFNNCDILHEFNCTIKCQNPSFQNKRGTMVYDNEMVTDNFNLLVEVHGPQHYRIVPWHYSIAKRDNMTPQEVLEYQQYRDQYKMDYALSQGYYYLAIPYWTEKSGEWKDLIDDKLQEIYDDLQT